MIPEHVSRTHIFGGFPLKFDSKCYDLRLFPEFSRNICPNGISMEKLFQKSIYESNENLKWIQSEALRVAAQSMESPSKKCTAIHLENNGRICTLYTLGGYKLIIYILVCCD